MITVLIVSCSSRDEAEIVFVNPAETPRTDEGVVLTREFLSEAGNIPEDALPALRVEDAYLPCQPDDLDGDGQWDELFVLLDMDAGEKITAGITYIPGKDYPKFRQRTNIRFARKDQDYREMNEAVRETHAINTETQKVWQMEGIGWENDLVGFRNYFDRRNSMDIFGKITHRMVLDSVGYKESPDYHLFNPDWGMDVLKVGDALGAGGIAVRYKDSLYRVGDNGTGTYNLITEGPLRSIFRLSYPDWQMGGKVLSVTHDISIQAGTYYYSSEVVIEGISEQVELVSGIVNKKSDSLYVAETAPGTDAFFTFDRQAEDTTFLGMGILLMDDHFTGTGQTPDLGSGIIETYTVGMETTAGQTATFRFYSVWEKEDERWRTPEGFGALLTEESRLMAKPVEFFID